MMSFRGIQRTFIAHGAAVLMSYPDVLSPTRQTTPPTQTPHYTAFASPGRACEFSHIEPTA